MLCQRLFHPGAAEVGHGCLLRRGQLFEYGWVLYGSRTTRRRSFSSSGAGGSGGSGPRASQRRSLAGHIFQNEHRAVASVHPRGWYRGKCDNLSFLRVCLSQMDKVPGGTNGYARSLRAGPQVSYGSIFLNPRQRVIRHVCLAGRQTDVESFATMKGPNQSLDHRTPAEEQFVL